VVAIAATKWFRAKCHQVRSWPVIAPIAKKSVTIVGGAGDNKHIAGLAKLDRTMQYPIIPRSRQNSDCRPADPCARIIWTHIGFH